MSEKGNLLYRIREKLFYIFIRHFALAPRGRNNKALWIRKGPDGKDYWEGAILPDRDDLDILD